MSRVPGVILAGGRATRMGGGDKGLLRLGGVTLLERVIARLGPQCAGLALNANGDPARFARFGLPVLADPLPGHPGPLAGVLAGLDWAAAQGAEAIVTAAADTPFLPEDLVARLEQAARAAGVPLALAAAPDEDGAPRRHPTFGLWPVALRGDLRAELTGGLRKIVLWTDRHNAASALFGAGRADPFFNVNTPQDMERAETLLPPLRDAALLPPLRAEAPLPPLSPPRLKDDCFALPPGVDWTPAEEALALLREGLSPVVGVEELDTGGALGRVLAADAVAARSNPPAPNAAVDGYGFAHAATGDGPQTLPLVAGRAAAGAPFGGTVPEGSAIRILTGAILPGGVDTVVLEEDTATDGARIAFQGPVKPRANTRKAGEDVLAGAVALPAGHRLRPPDLALLSAVGVGRVAVHRPLRVGVLSTGDEIAGPGEAAPEARIYDANRPMLLSLARRWGYAPVDLGHVGDDRAALAERLDRATEAGGARAADVIFTSGGASAGEEDHVSALLRAEGALQSWCIAIKPGRPLALGLWRGVPVFGLPGNPVAAFVCALIFGRPALSVLAGGGWEAPVGFTVPAAFAKDKKPGRREYLRARLTPEGRAEVFASEGSGRISGLSWATGLVELEDGARRIAPGDPVRFLPYGSFGL